MNKRTYLIVLAAILIAVSAVIYYIHFLIFHDEHHIFIFMLHDIAFLPLEVLIVGLVIERILAKRESDEKIEKLNMVVGAFFSEIGRPLVAMMLNATSSKDEIISRLSMSDTWEASDYNNARSYIKKNGSFKFDKADLGKLREFLVDKRSFLLRLIENPNLLEHEKFTDLLLASFHLTEELETRDSLTGLPKNDMLHIDVDMQRAFNKLCLEWLDYMQHLKKNYPFLYSHYLRVNPYKLHPSAVIE